MADINSVIVKIDAARDEASAVAGVPTQSVTIAGLQAQVTQLTNDKAALQAKYDSYVAAVRTAAQADKAQDDAREAGQGVLDVPV